MIKPFIAKYASVKNVGTNSVNTGECVGLVMKYITDKNLPWFPGDAKDLLDTAPDKHFRKILKSSGELPQEGDIAVFNKQWGNGYGHTGIIVEATSSQFKMFEQNNPYGSPPRIVTHHFIDYRNMIGWLRIKESKEEEVQKVNKGDINNFCLFLLGRAPTKEDYARVGTPWKETAEAYMMGNEFVGRIKQLSDRSAAAAELEKARDKYDYPQIESLKTQLENAKKEATNEQLNRIENMLKQLTENNNVQ